MPSKQLYIDGSNGTTCIVNYGNATNARTNPYGNLDDVYLHSSLEYLQFRETVSKDNVSFSAVDRAYYTWSDGGGKGGGICFITTACVEHMGMHDQCYELNALRKFRDRRMFRSFDGVKKVMWYYDNAPTIVRRLNSMTEADALYKDLFSDFILPAVKAIEDGNDDLAESIYDSMVFHAANLTGVQIGTG